MRSEFYSFQDSVKGKMEDMNALFKELLQEVWKQRPGRTPPASSEVGTIGLEEDPPQEEGHPEVITIVDPVWAKKSNTSNADVVNSSMGEVVKASPERCA